LESELIHKQQMSKDYLLLGIVTLMSVGANLPRQFAGLSGVDRKLLLIGLLVVVSIALIRYSKFTLVLAVAILAIGANLPQEIASALNIEPKILLLTLVTVVMLSLGNRLLKLPSGLEQEQGFAGNEGIQALLSAIANERVQIVSRLIAAGINIHARSAENQTALMIAASNGNEEIVQLLLDHGAKPTTIDSEGRNAVQIAKDAGHERCARLLIAASKACITNFDEPLPSN
jgi:hypothetical protein